MRIGLITHQFPGVRGGGIGTYILEAAAALRAAGHELHVFTLTLPEDVRGTVPVGVHLHEVKDLAQRMEEGSLPGALAGAIESGGEGIYRLALGWLLCEEAREFHKKRGLDVIEVPEYEALGLPLLLRPEANLAIVTHMHLCSAIARAGNEEPEKPDARSEKSDWDGGKGVIDALESAAVVLADGVCAATRNIVEETERFLGVGRGAEVIPYPMRLHEDQSAPPENGPVLFVGRLERRKGTGLMAAAFNQFLSRNPEATVRLVGADTRWGEGSSRARIEAGLDEGVRRRVVFAGEKSPVQVRAEFVLCRFSIVPSLLENFAYAAVESLAAGRAVVVGDETGAVEVVGNAGVAIKKGDAEGLAAGMEKLWRDRPLCQRLGERARKRAVELFSMEKTVAARLRFYERAIAQVLSRGSVWGRLSALNQRHVGPLLQAMAALTGTLAGVADAGGLTPGRRLLALMDAISRGEATEVLLYGAGRHTARLLVQRHLWESKGHRVVGLIDDHPRFAEGGMQLGLAICSGAAVLKRLEAKECIPSIALSTDTLEEQFWERTARMRELGARVFRLYG